MKYKGQRPGPNIEFLVLTRPDGEIELKFQPILDYGEFETMCPEPELPIKILPGGKREPNPDDPDYKKQVSERNLKRLDYIVLKALKPNTDLEWEKVVFEKPETWKLWKDELREASFTPPEINKIIVTALSVNTVDEEKVEAAKKRFLASQGGKDQ